MANSVIMANVGYYFWHSWIIYNRFDNVSGVKNPGSMIIGSSWMKKRKRNNSKMSKKTTQKFNFSCEIIDPKSRIFHYSLFTLSSSWTIVGKKRHSQSCTYRLCVEFSLISSIFFSILKTICSPESILSNIPSLRHTIYHRF